MAFIQKNWQKNAGANAVSALMRVSGAATSAVSLKMIADKATGSGLKKTLGNIAAPAMTAIGVIIDLVAQSPLGLSGFDGEIMNGAEIMNGSEEVVYVDEDGNVVNGLGTDESTTADMPEELIAAQTGADPNGKAFAEVADYIEQGADNAISVNGAIGNFGELDEDEIINARMTEE